MAHKLKRELSFFQATLYGVGIILGAGIYVLVGKAAGAAGNLFWLSFAIAAIIAAFTGLSYAELASMFPRNAAEYVNSLLCALVKSAGRLQKAII